jgi:hypothetical protein
LYQCIRTTGRSSLAWLLLWFLAVPDCDAAGQPGQDVDDLRRAVIQKDAEISELQRELRDVTRRLDALEQRAVNPGTSAPSKAAAMSGTPTAAQPEASASAVSAEAEVSDEEMGRALEATLVQQHVAVLSAWTLQVTPSAFYEYQRTSSITAASSGGVTSIATQDSRFDGFGADVGLRLGLPGDTQAELVLPLAYERARSVAADTEQSSTISGLADIQLWFSKKVLEERGRRPALLASMGWKTTTGKTLPESSSATPPTGTPLGPSAPILSLGTGFDSLTWALTASKRQDPMVFYATGSYTLNLPGQAGGASVHPGDTIGFGLGGALALSPTASVSADFAAGFSARDKVNGAPKAGSDQIIGIFELGSATALTPRLVLNIGLGFGVTPNAPDFIVTLALPFRF